MTMATMELESKAHECAGNHRTFDSFCWYDRPEDSDNWGIIYTVNRDSGIVDRCNAKEIDKALSPFVETGDVIAEHHSHWAVGWVDGYAIRVFADGEITGAFRAYFDLLCRIDDYPILNESRLSDMEVEESATAWNDWAERDFRKAFEKRFKVDCTADDKAILKLFNDTADRTSENWREDGGSMYIDVDKVACAVDFDEALPFLDTSLSDRALSTLAGLLPIVEALPNFGSICAGADTSAIAVSFAIENLAGRLQPASADDLWRLLFAVMRDYPALVAGLPTLAESLAELDTLAGIGE